MSDFPTVLSNLVDGIPGVGSPIYAKHVNDLEVKVGINGSAVVTSLDYLLKSTSCIDPGHKHTPAYGGTGIYSYTVGSLLYPDTATTMAQLLAVAVNNVLLSGGVGAPPAWGKVPLAAIANMATGALLGRNTAGAGIPEVITDIPTAITIGGAYVYRAGGTNVAAADGGTGQSSYAVGDLIYANSTTTLAKLADVAVGSYLKSGGIGVIPAWATLNQAAIAGLTTADGP